MRSIVAVANQLRDRAAPRNISHKTNVLYEMLAECMALAEQCARDPASREALLAAFRQQAAIGNRRYVEATTDDHLLVCRYVFDSGPNANRQGAWRYGRALKEAADRQIGSDGLARYLAANGGIAHLFLNRPVERRTTETRTLHLTRPVSMPKGEVVTLCLRHSHGPFFDVLSQSGGAK